MNRILILCEQPSDLSALLQDCTGAVCYAPESADIPFDNFDALCVLGGNGERPLVLSAPVRYEVERMRGAGKPVFCEFVASVGCVYSDTPAVTTHHRLIYDDGGDAFAALRCGDVMDAHRNERIPYYFIPATARNIMTYHDYICAHDYIAPNEELRRSGAPALWFLDDTTLLCAFRLCNFNRARLAPRERWQRLIRGIVAYLAGEAVEVYFPAPRCTHRPPQSVHAAADTDKAVARGLRWFLRADILKQNGARGVKEGFSHHIRARDGVQLRADQVRTDCTGEVGGAFLLDYLCTGNEQSRAIYQETADFCFDYMQIKQGEHSGMMRWSEMAWETCYQDDVARAILPTLLCANFGGDTAHFDDAVAALRYMADTTGEDGLRVFRTDCCDLPTARREQLKQAGVGIPCAHYNAYYHAALLLATRGGADRCFADLAVRGLESIMALYPDTRRETSETEEMCRLVLPLALLYEYTGEQRHYDKLCRVTEDLARVQHPSGGYAEWDTGYRAACARNDRGECALLANNGDPVADLLYSNNWLPLGFAYAYMVTGEQHFHQKWCEIAAFLLRCQLQSDDPLLDGAWTRAMDMNRMESYGVPHDVGWAPCCIESGWTVAEILMGLQFMHVAEKQRRSASAQ